ncbi:MAG: TIGR03560 family F420-dependent LLM class oxidoreductase [Chloroflexi bacterium]|nr:MAG: TIGR03560 family F420-dependent LLM class oxidoreductase [Chloroflexota bacterium]TMF37173.1 MAG: TIGR03560 family F420-dependent LLM class oxidoreductase [Chloroflexota bacterium]
MTHPLRFGLKASGQNITIEQLRAAWQIADEGGFDHLWDFDHLASIGPTGPDRPIYEGWALQAAMAEATKRVRIGCLVTGNTYRHPVVLAKLAVTVDHLSGGRLELGIGAAWAEIEHQMYGIEGLDHRVGRLSESLQIIKSLFTEERTNFDGRYYKLTDAIANPKPIQKPYPPLWIGAQGESTLRLTARHADVWNISGGDPAFVKDVIGKFEDACGAVGRDPSEVRRSLQFGWESGDRSELIELSGKYYELGVTEQVIYLRGHHPEKLAEKIVEALPDLRRLERVHSSS